ncbi:WhiB family transcriptional regulator [Streptomyces sp. NPDC052013]|uniref:WhiB family transcriptional regulator n=1 Tax=Streptomyces sp. NPDC052013 TaxID=3365679 RepID=UPI0037D754E2
MTETAREWELRAACRDMDPDIWFSGRKRAQALATCRACPVLDACREAVLRREAGVARDMRSGIIAGLTGAQRYALGEQPKPRKSAKKPTGRPRSREIPECGTRSAYQRHVRLKEPIDDACRAANAAAIRGHRRNGSIRVPAAG